MSNSSLFGIKSNYTGGEVAEFNNSWLFTPIICKIMPEKYIPNEIETGYGYKKGIIGIGGQKVWKSTNDKVNKCENTPDRVCWELSNQQIFFTKNKEFVAESIMKFVEQNKAYCKDEEDEISPLEREHIIERFQEVANSIKELDEQEYPYFVFKNTSCDDGVEYWFSKYNEETEENEERSLKEIDKFVAEFVVINNGKIDKFIPNTEFCYE